MQFGKSPDKPLCFDIVASDRRVCFLRGPVGIDIRLIGTSVVQLRQGCIRLLRRNASVKIFPHVPVRILLLELELAADIEREDLKELRIRLLILLTNLRIPALRLR